MTLHWKGIVPKTKCEDSFVLMSKNCNYSNLLRKHIKMSYVQNQCRATQTGVLYLKFRSQNFNLYYRIVSVDIVWYTENYIFRLDYLYHVDYL